MDSENPTPDIELVPVETEPMAATILYELLKEATPEQSISHQVLPSWETHCRFVSDNYYRRWWLIKVADTDIHIGMLYLTDRNEIGIRLFQFYCGRGYGSAAIRQALTELPPLPALPSVRSGRWLANINPSNAASIRMFERLGFSLLQHTYAKD